MTTIVKYLPCYLVFTLPWEDIILLLIYVQNFEFHYSHNLFCWFLDQDGYFVIESVFLIGNINYDIIFP
jgi:hypothetical protein